MISNDDNDAQPSVELLDAMLPRLQTSEEKRRVVEGFQRALLDEQLRLAAKVANNKRVGGDDMNDFLADNEEEVSRVSDLFQQARLSEQLRLSKTTTSSSSCDTSQDAVFYNGSDTNNEDDIDMHMLTDEEYDQRELFQRSLLEERLQSRRVQGEKHQQQKRLALSTSDSLELAMMEYEEERSKKEGQQQQQQQMGTMATVMVHESVDNDGVTSGEEDSRSGEKGGVNDAIIIRSASSSNDNSGKVRSMGELLLNQTDGSGGSAGLDAKLARLHQMVAVTTSSPKNNIAISERSDGRTKSPFLSTTYLPLPPREDASISSLLLAPIAHIISSLFLLGAASFYAIMAVLDVISNDKNTAHSTRSCMRETSSVLKGCWGYVFPPSSSSSSSTENEVNQSNAAQRTMKALQISVIASFYMIQCICARAVKWSKYANESMEAGTGALRYSVYALRSVKVIWIRMGHYLRRRSRHGSGVNLIDHQKSTKLYTNKILLQVFSRIKGIFSKDNQTTQDRQNESSQHDDGRRMRLNQDRLILERDKLQLKEAQHQLELERQKLLSEGMNVLVWTVAVKEAQGALLEDDEMKGHDDNSQTKKRHWWNRRR